MTTRNKPTTKNKFRLANNLSLGFFSVVCCGVALWLAEPAQPFAEAISLGTGYAGLILLLITLLIGPLNMLRVRKNPVNINIRRDAGIWAGITALLHVIFSFQVFFDGNLLRYFFNDENGKLTPLFDLFGLSNDVGLVALGIILFLTVISSNYFLRQMKGKLWKNLQRLNYLLAALTLAHTFGQQFSNNRNAALIYGVIGFTLVVLVSQSIGFAVYRQRDDARKAGASAATRPQAVSTSQPQLEPAGNTAAIGRRRFIIAAGAASLASFGVGAALPSLLAGNSQAKTLASVSLPDTQAPAPTATATSPAASTGRQRGSRNGTVPGATPTPATGASSAAPVAGSVGSSAQATATPAAASAVTGGTVLATIAKLPASGVQQFWTPDTHKNAFLVRESDGSIKAFSGVCPHRPYDLVYKEDKKQFYCALHAAYFNGQTGSVISGPVRSGLPTISKVQVDKQGNIIYTTV